MYMEFLVVKTIEDYDLSTTSINVAQADMQYHNNIVNQILAGNRELEREHKMSCINIILMNDQKADESKAKLALNKANSSEVLAPIKALRKLGDFGKWLNVKGNPYRTQHFNKKYTAEAVEAFIQTL
jgi:hypothetical protein